MQNYGKFDQSVVSFSNGSPTFKERHYCEFVQSHMFSLVCVVWFAAKKEQNRMAHALNGNTVDVMFYGDSSCYAKADTKTKKTRSYKSDVSWELHGYDVDIMYKPGGKVSDIVSMILNGP